MDDNVIHISNDDYLQLRLALSELVDRTTGHITYSNFLNAINPLVCPMLAGLDSEDETSPRIRSMVPEAMGFDEEWGAYEDQLTEEEFDNYLPVFEVLANRDRGPGPVDSDEEEDIILASTLLARITKCQTGIIDPTAQVFLLEVWRILGFISSYTH